MTKIEWCDATWSPMTGCSHISPGCNHCFARRMATRLRGRCGYPADDPFRVTLHEDRLDIPLRWKKPRMVFVCSMGDLFHDRVPDNFITKVFAVMALAYRHRFVILTKRPLNMRNYIKKITEQGEGNDVEYFASQEAMSWGATEEAEELGGGWFEGQRGEAGGWELPPGFEDLTIPWPLSNVILGVSIENQATAIERIPLLLETPATARVISYEPAIGPVNFDDGPLDPESTMGPWSMLDGISWLIAGVETGSHARICHSDWIRKVRDQAIACEVPFFFKRGSNGSRLLDGYTWDQIPERK